MIRIRYEPISDRIETFSVAIIDRIPWLIGVVHLADNGRWTARARSEPMMDSVGGWVRRTDAARWLLISQGFCWEPTAPLDWRAAA